jgi:hypothetical protein
MDSSVSAVKCPAIDDREGIDAQRRDGLLEVILGAIR